MSTKEGGVGWREAEAPPSETESIVWSEDAGRFQMPDDEAFLEYRVPSLAVMDMVHTYVPRSKRGQGLAARLCDAAFAHARGRGMRVVPTCSYISVRGPDPLSSSAALPTGSSPASRARFYCPSDSSRRIDE